MLIGCFIETTSGALEARHVGSTKKRGDASTGVCGVVCGVPLCVVL